MGIVKKLACVAVGLSLIIGLGAGCAAEAPTEEPLLIGSIGPRTGWGGVYASEMMDIKHVYVKNVNAEGGIHGRQMKLIEYDNESDVELTITYIKKMIEKDNVLAISGPIFSAESVAGIEAAKFQGVPLVYESTSTLTPEWNQSGSGIFSFNPSAEAYVYATVDYLIEKYGVRTIAILATTDESGAEDLEYNEVAAEDLGVEVIATERIDPQAIDATPQLTRIKAANPDALCLGGAGDVIGPLMKGIKLMGLDIPVVGPSGSTSKEMFVLIKGYEPEKLVLPCMMYHVASFDVLPLDHPQMQAAERMVDMWMAEYGETRGTREELLTGWIMCGYDGITLIGEALRQAGPLPEDLEDARAAVNYAMENKIIDFWQVSGKRTLTPTDHLGMSVEDVTLLTIKEGKLVVLE